MLDLINDIKGFYDGRCNKLSLSNTKYQAIEQELEDMVINFKEILPPECRRQLIKLEECCAYKRELSNSLIYEIGFREGFKAFLYTVFMKN
jgi:hypothetical protein